MLALLLLMTTAQAQGPRSINPSVMASQHAATKKYGPRIEARAKAKAKKKKK